MIKVSSNVSDQFKEIRDIVIARMEKDAALLIWLSEEWCGEDVPGNNIITDKYSICITKRGS